VRLDTRKRDLVCVRVCVCVGACVWSAKLAPRAHARALPPSLPPSFPSALAGNVNARNKEGQTALGAGAAGAHVAVMRHLLSRPGVNVHLDSLRKSPIVSGP
jgi:hypothetical protein